MVSIIVPVYNCGGYLDKCISSVLEQTHRNFELILVDDGSSDGSGAVCDAYAQKDGRIKVIHQENAGVSTARNAGLELAQGEYIGFLDADDWFAPELLETVVSQMEGADICMFDAVTVWEDGRQEEDTIGLLPQSRVLERKDWTPVLLREMAGTVWRCMYRRELLKNIRFPEGLKFSEDRVFNLYAMGKAERLCYCKQGLYFRLMQEESAVHRYHGDYFETYLLADRHIRFALDACWSGEDYRRAYDSQLVAGALGAVNNYFYKTSPLTLVQRLDKVRGVVRNERLCRALAQCDMGGVRVALMKRRQVWALSVCAWLANKRHGR